VWNAENLLKQERKRPVWMHRNGWEDNIKVDNKIMGCEDLDWIKLAHGRCHTVMNCQVP
jgi:hypothetical protein